jgi:hypothetical protein
MRSRIRPAGGGGTTTTVVIGGNTYNTPTVTEPEKIQAVDSFGIVQLRQDDINMSADRVNLASVRPEISVASDAIASVTSSRVTNVLFNTSSTAPLKVVEAAQARTGSADSNSWGDAGANGGATTQSTNYGNFSPLPISAVAGVTGIAYFYVDLRRFSGFTQSSTLNSTFSFWASLNSVVASTGKVTYGASASKPFTESTLTYSNRPANPTALNTGTFAPAANGGAGGQAAQFTHTINSAVTSALGGFLFIVMEGNSATDGNLYVATRESTAPPSMTLNIVRL